MSEPEINQRALIAEIRQAALMPPEAAYRELMAIWKRHPKFPLLLEKLGDLLDKESPRRAARMRIRILASPDSNSDDIKLAVRQLLYNFPQQNYISAAAGLLAKAPNLSRSELLDLYKIMLENHRLSKAAAKRIAALLQDDKNLDFAKKLAGLSFYNEAEMLLPAGEEANNIRSLTSQRRKQITPQLFLISGSMRTGTTLLSQLFTNMAKCGHIDGLCMETDTAQLLRGAGPFWNDNELADPWLKFTPEKAKVANWLNRPDITDASAATSNALIDDIIFRTGAVAPVKTVGFKSTFLIGQLGLFLLSNPSAKVIITIRDPRDVLSSHLMRVKAVRNYYSGYVGVLEILAYQYLDLDEFKGRVMFVKYEDFSRAPRKIFNGVCKFLGFKELTDKEFFELSTSLNPNSSYGKMKGVANISPIFSESIGSYKKYLSPADIWLAEQLCAGYMKRYGYKPSSPLKASDMHDYFTRSVDEIMKMATGYKYSTKPLEKRLTEIKSSK